MFLLTLLTLLASAAVWWCFRYLQQSRRIHASEPSLPRHFLWGNIVQLGKYMKPDRHPSTYQPNAAMAR